MKKIIWAVTTAVMFFCVANAQALVISWSPAISGSIDITPLTQSAIDGPSSVSLSALTPFVSLSLYNETSQSVVFDIGGFGWSTTQESTVYSLDGMFNFNDISIAPGATYSNVLLYVGGISNVPGVGLAPSTVGDFARIQGISVMYTLNGAMDFIDEAASQGNYLWAANVIAPPDTGGGGTAPVPEPTTMVLFGTGLAGLAAVGRKRKV
jgi:hypothetical protein